MGTAVHCLPEWQAPVWVLTGFACYSARKSRSLHAGFRKCTYTSGTITKQAYLDEKRIIDEKLHTIENSIDAAKQHIADLESLEKSEPQTSQLERFLNEPILTYEMAHAFVEAVYIYSDGTNEICWKYKDFTEGNPEGINQS